MLYRIVRWLLRLIFVPLGLKTVGLEKMPADGPIIIAANHVSMWDPFMVALALKRTVHFMSKDEIFKITPLGWLLNKVYVFPVKRGTPDTAAIKHSLTVLKEGNVLGIFPEGTRNREHEKLKPHAGMALFAIRSGAPVLPVAVTGTEHGIVCGWIWPLRVIVGEPLYFSGEQYKKAGSATLDEVSQEIMDKILDLI